MIYTPHFESFKEVYSAINPAWIQSFPNLAPDWEKMKGKNFTLLNILLDKIHKEKDNTFIFITTPEQGESFEEFVTKYELKDLIVMQTPYLTNANTGVPSRLQVTVIQTKDHFQRREAKGESSTAG